MKKITKAQYEFALKRIEELLPLVSDETPSDDALAVELSMMSDLVIDYENEHYPIEVPTVAELIETSLADKNMTQRELASRVGVSPSRINDFVTGKSEPSLRIASLLCQTLNIQPAMMLGL